MRVAVKGGPRSPRTATTPLQGFPARSLISSSSPAGYAPRSVPKEVTDAPDSIGLDRSARRRAGRLQPRHDPAPRARSLPRRSFGRAAHGGRARRLGQGVRDHVDVRRPAARLLAGGLRLPPQLRVAGPCAARSRPAARLFGLLRLRQRLGHDQPSLRPQLHHRCLDPGLQLPGNRLRGAPARRRKTLPRHVGGPAPIHRGRHRQDPRRRHRARSGRPGAPARLRHRRTAGDLRAGDQPHLPGGQLLSGGPLFHLSLPALQRCAPGHGPRGTDRVLRRRPGQLHLSPLRPGCDLPPGLPERRTPRHRSLPGLECSGRRRRGTGLRDR